MYTTEKIAILMATYNGEKYIREQIDSILSQSYKQWELYIHDDGSNDKTNEIISMYADQYPEKIHIVRGGATGGAKNNFMFLMGAVKAPYVMCCDQDDVWLDDKIKRTIKAMKNAENYKGVNTPILVFSDLKVVDEKLNIISGSMNRLQRLNPKKTKFTDILIQSLVTGCTMMMNRSCIEMSLKVKHVNSIIMHDWWCSLVAAYFGEIV